ncbi:PolC-type DNA polymerase III [Candidatus Latescibacterota bacterium]
MSPRQRRYRECLPTELDDLVVFDLETTGLSPSADDIIQIAATRVRGGQLVEGDGFFSYVKPSGPIPPFITSYTGVTDDDVREAPREWEVLSAFAQYSRDAVLVAHNGHSFDMNFLRSACAQNVQPSREVEYVDSMHLSWAVWGRQRGSRHGLDAVASRLQVVPPTARRHDARGDVELTAQCVVQLLDLLKGAEEVRPVKVYVGTLPE